MKKLILLIILILSACAPLEPLEMDGELIRYCNDPLLVEGEPCITDDRGLLLSVIAGSIVFLSSLTGAGYYIINKKRDS